MFRNVLALMLSGYCLSIAYAAQSQNSQPSVVKSGTQAPPVPLMPLPSAAGTQATPTPATAPHTQDTPVPPPILLPPPPLSIPDIPNRPITADEAARIALRLQPNITVARDNILAQQGRTQQLRSGLLPQLSVLGSYTHIENFATEGSSSGNGPVSTGTGTGTTGSTGGTTGTTSGGSTGVTSGGATTSGGASGSGTVSGTGSTGVGTGTTGTTGTGSTGSGSTTGTSTTGTTTGGTTTGGATTVTQLGASSTTTGEGTVAQATLRQLIYDFNHTRDLVRQSEALERAAVQALSGTQLNTVLLVKQAYYQLVQYQQLTRVNEANVANRQSQLELTEARLRSGLGLPSDVVTAQTAKAEAIQGLNIARAQESVARLTLAYNMGIDPRTPIQTAETGERALPSDDVNALVQTAIQRRPEILQAQELIRSARFGVNSARSTNAPVISGNVNLTSRGTDFPPGNDSFSVGASVQFTPFDGGLTRGLVKTARANLDAAVAQLLGTQLSVQADVTQAYLNLRAAEQRVSAANSEVVNAEEGVRIATGRYRAGLGQFLDIINAQAFVVSARTNLVTTQSLVEQNRAALSRSIGASIGTP